MRRTTIPLLGLLLTAGCTQQPGYQSVGYREPPPTFMDELVRSEARIDATGSRANREAFARCKALALQTYATHPSTAYAPRRADEAAAGTMGDCLHMEAARMRAQAH